MHHGKCRWVSVLFAQCGSVHLVLHWKKLGTSPSYGAWFKGELWHGYRENLILFVQGSPSSGSSQYGGQVRNSSCVVLIQKPRLHSFSTLASRVPRFLQQNEISKLISEEQCVSGGEQGSGAGVGESCSMLLGNERWWIGFLVLSSGIALNTEWNSQQTRPWPLKTFMVRFIGEGIRRERDF